MSEQEINVPLPNLAIVLRETEGLSQRGLAAFLGIHESNISRLITGKAKMLTPERIRLIEQYTGQKFEYLANLKDAAKQDEQILADAEAISRAPKEVQEFIRASLAPYRK